jgi:hypothetical protein
VLLESIISNILYHAGINSTLVLSPLHNVSSSFDGP